MTCGSGEARIVLANPEVLKNEGVRDRLAALGNREKLLKRKKDRRAVKDHRWLTGDVEQPAFRNRIMTVMALMKATANGKVFQRLVKKCLLVKGEQQFLDLYREED